MRRSAPIDADMLLMALEHHDPDVTYYLDLQTGEIEFISQAYSDADEREEFEEMLQNDLERYVTVEPISSREGWRIMSDFIAGLPESEARERLEVAIHRNRPFRRFKDTLHDYPDLRQRWFRFHEERLLELAREWLDAEEIEAELRPLPGREPERPQLRIIPREEPTAPAAAPLQSVPRVLSASEATWLWPFTPLPRLYGELVWLWPFVSPPEHHLEEAEAYASTLRAHGVADGSTLLHLGSGGGSLDYHLKRHYRVTGVDLSPAVLEHARELNPEVEYLAADIRSVRLERTFDAVLLQDTAAYLTSPEELRAVHRSAGAHLATGGVLLTRPQELRSHFVQHRTCVATRSSEERTVTTVAADFDPDPQDCVFERTYVFLIRESGSLTVETDTHRLGLFELEELLDALHAEGFEPEVRRLERSGSTPESDYPLLAAVKRR